MPPVKRSTLILAALYVAALTLGVSYLVQKRSGADLCPSDPGTARLSPSSRSASGTEVGAFSSNVTKRPTTSETASPERQALSGATGGGPSSSSLILSWIGHDDLDPGMYPTADGLWARTGELWSDESFLSLTEDELHDLLALDDSFGFRGPRRITDILGRLPTKADCEEAVRDEIVEMELASVCTDELCLLAATEHTQRHPEFKPAVDECRARLASNELKLMQTLDERSRFKHWTILYKAWRRWSQ